MTGQMLRPLLESVLADPHVKHLSGPIKSADALLESDVLARLDERHRGIFAFILFNENLDKPFVDYLAGDSLADDTGPDIFALYEARPKSRTNRRREDEKDGALASVKSENPIVGFARALFPDAQLLLPGIVIVERLAVAGDAVFVHFKLDTSAPIAQRFRSVWKCVGEEWRSRSPERQFSQSLGVRFAKEGIPYFRSEGASVKEQVISLLRALWDIRRDLMAFVPLVGKSLAKKKSEE